MQSKRPWGLFGYALAIWGVLLLVVLLMAFAALRDVRDISGGADGTFLSIGLPIFLIGLVAPVVLLKALARWSRDVEGDDSEFRLRDVPKEAPPHPVTPAPPQSGTRPPVGTPPHPQRHLQPQNRRRHR